MTFAALDSALFGPLFTTQAMREVFSDRALLSAMLAAEMALARAEAHAGLVPAAIADEIAAIRTDDLDLAAIGAETAAAGVLTIPFVTDVRRRLSPQARRWFHHGATSQDILDTAIVLTLRDAFAALVPDLDRTLAGLARMAREHRETAMVGRTYGQHAAPITFGYQVATWALGIADSATALPALRSRVLVASLGGPVGTLASLGPAGPAVAAEFARQLRLAATPAAWHAIRGRIVETGAWLAALIGTLAKMATDVVQLGSTDVGDVSEPATPDRGGSTAMPHKQNPVSATVIIAAHIAAPGHLSTLLAAMAVPGQRGAGSWQAEWHALPQLFGLAAGALREAARLAEGLGVHADQMRRNLGRTRGLIFAAAAGEALRDAIDPDTADRTLSRAIATVRTGDLTLADALAADEAIPPQARKSLALAFDLAPHTAAAAVWTDRALAAVDAARRQLGTSHARD